MAATPHCTECRPTPARRWIMLSPADADLVRRDTALPGLAMMLDPGAFAEALCATARTARPDMARITYVRYKPGTSCLIGYRMEWPDQAADVTATACSSAARDKVTKARERRG